MLLNRKYYFLNKIYIKENSQQDVINLPKFILTMGNCLGIEKEIVTENPDDKLFKEMLEELRERRVKKNY